MLAFALFAANGVASGQLAAQCAVPTLSVAARSAGDMDALRYIAERRREFEPDLMGYRAGPQLPRPSRGERNEIAFERRTRLQFALNPSRLLIRRLLRDRSEAVKDSVWWLGIRLTPLEVQSVKFEGTFQQSTGLADDYRERCARRDDGGAYFSYHPGRPQLFVVNVTQNVARYLNEYRARFRYWRLLRVQQVRFSLIVLRRVQHRIDRDWRHKRLLRLGLQVTSTGIDEKANRVVVTLSHPSQRAARIFRQRYGPAVHTDRQPAVFIVSGGQPDHKPNTTAARHLPL